MVDNLYKKKNTQVLYYFYYMHIDNIDDCLQMIYQLNPHLNRRMKMTR